MTCTTFARTGVVVRSREIRGLCSRKGDNMTADEPTGAVRTVGAAVQNPSTHADDRGYQARPHADTIPCPGLAALYNQGALKPDADGTVMSSHFDEVLSGIGLTKTVRRVLVHVADKTDAIRGSFNLFQLRQSYLNHPGSTGVRDPVVNVAQLPELLKFGENGRMYSRHFAVAANHFLKVKPDRGPGSFDVKEHVPTFAAMNNEFAAGLMVFGRVDERGERYLTFEDIRDLWIEARYPKGWTPPTKDSLDVAGFTGGVTRIAWWRIWERLRSAFGRRQP
jgi:hypothetical protein